MNNKILLFIIIFIFISCKNKDDLGLTNQAKKWVYYNSPRDYNRDSVGFIMYLKFYKKGKCANFFVVNDEQDYKPEMDWKFTKSDSTLEIGGNRFLVRNIYTDSIILKDLKYNRKVKLLNWNVLKKNQEIKK
ncbi:hypothetical protein [Flavobacterium sp. LC2016-01]|uniref:hypothetical protein n=1 Tax=Flavobacterium sp. LC2016-01 TaxID=2675876 RepID=UPI0012BA8475|nr:hypothetical protein [Flavobacterium sp. LC2016-01]MTH16057.1 hypothetical protein [Flavobacterium sp. LC2016-01]